MQPWLPWALLSAVFAALTAILAKAGVSPDVTAGPAVDANVATAVRTSVVFVLAWVVTLVGDGGGEGMSGLRGLPARGWLALTLSGLATGGSWWCYFRALARGHASQVAPVDKLSVPFTLLLAALVLGERLTWREWLGGGLILAGAVVIAWRPADA